MKKENYFWVAFALIMVVGGSYLVYSRYYAPTTVSISVSLGNRNGNLSIYPYQEVSLPVTINNTGSTGIIDMGVSTLVNGNSTYVYGVTLPAGKSATFYFNYTAERNGTYNLTVMADPGKLYNIVDRNKAAASTMLDVMSPQLPQAYSILPAGNATTYGNENLNTLGYIFYSYLAKDYGISQFNITRMQGLDSFLTPFLTVVGSAISNMDVAHASYANGSSVYSIWMQGPLKPEAIHVGAVGMKLNSSNYTVNGSTVTLVSLSHNESLCSWYSNGWIKMLAADGNQGCLAYMSSNVARFTSMPKINLTNPFYLNATAGSQIEVVGNSIYEGYTGAIGNLSIVYTGRQAGASSFDNVCMGTVYFYNNVSYCTEYVQSTGGAINATSLIKTYAMKGGYNITALGIVNTSKILQQVPVSAALLDGLNITGSSKAFISGISNACSFNSAFGCANASFTDNALSIKLFNGLNSTVKLLNATCEVYGNAKPSIINESLPSSNITQLSIPCYEGGTLLGSIPEGYQFTLNINYTANGTIYGALGNAYVIG